MLNNCIHRTKRLRNTLVAWMVCVALSLTTMLGISVTASAASNTDITAIVQLAYAIQANNTGMGEINSSINNNVVIENDWVDPTAANKDAVITNEGIRDIITYGNLYALSTALNNSLILEQKTPKLRSYAQAANAILKGFPSQTDYQTALTKLCSVSWTTTVTMRTPQPGPNTQPNAVTAAISSFTGAIAQGTVTDAFSSTFDMSGWNPNAGIAGAALATVGNIVNQIFFVLSNLMMLFFMVQTGADILYLIVEPVRPFLTKGEGNSQGLGSNGNARVLSRIRLPICSSSAIEAAGGGGGGLVAGGQNGAGGGKGAMVLKYLASRAPVLILGAIYLILVTLGYWQRLIGWIAGFVVQALDWLTTLGK